MSGLFPFNKNRTRTAQTSSLKVYTTLRELVEYDAGTPGALVANHYVVSADMKNGAYTLAHTSPTGGGARNVTVGHTATSTVDTLGTILVTGTDLADAIITETITPSNGTTVQGTKAFKTITSIVGSGWTVNSGADKIVVGFGDLIGLPDKLASNSVFYAVYNSVREATAPTVTFSSSVLASNTVDLNTVLAGAAVKIIYAV